MKKKMILIATAVGALALAPLAPVAHADPVKARKGGVAQRSHNLDEVAYRLHDATQDLRREVIRATKYRHGGFGPWGAGHGNNKGALNGQTLNLVKRLELESDRFLAAVDRRNIHQINRRFDRMCAIFEDVSFKLDRVRARKVQEDFQRVSRLMSRVERNVKLANGYGRDYRNGEWVDTDYRRPRPAPARGEVILGKNTDKGRFKIRIGF